MVGSAFDAIIILDWSASKTPKRGADSIWWAEARAPAGKPRIVAVSNPATRAVAMAELEHRLRSHLKAERRVLLGFDFPDGYPRGFAKAAGLYRRSQAPWLSVWAGLFERLTDLDDNTNNRFQVAGELNKIISDCDYPFWGLPVGASFAHINMKRPAVPDACRDLTQRRICETWVPRTKTCWQLCYTGSVGSQALLGIARLYALRFKSDIANTLRVWPFETGLHKPDPDISIVLAEVYPSLFPLDRVGGSVKDEQQVKATALALLRRALSGDLEQDFSGPDALSQKERRIIEREEGWILGAGTLTKP